MTTRIGIAGIGFMGMIHYLTYEKIRGARVEAICEQDARRLAGDWRGIRGNFGPPGTMMDLSGVRRYSRLDELLADPRIDMIDVCLPPALHAPVVISGLRAGKHVFCEKPIALTAADAQRMVAAAEKAERVLSIGHVLPFFPEYAEALKIVRSGRFGKLLGGGFRRVISDPQWLPDFYDPRKIGGPMLDLHVHDAHWIRLLFGMPRSVFTTGRMRGDVAEYFTTQFQFDDPSLAVTATSGVIRQQGRLFEHGFEIHLERATLLFDFAVFRDGPKVLMPLTVLDDKGSVRAPQLGSSDPLDAFQAELNEVVRSVRQQRPSQVLHGDLARDAVILCHKQTASLKTGRPQRIA
jgi:predicted dehydrogenase